MKKGTISQRQAHGYRRQVKALEARVRALEEERDSLLRAWGNGPVFGTEIASLTVSGETGWVGAALYTARRLGHPVLAVSNGMSAIRFMALPVKGSAT